jgi:hypothetical protein
MQPLAIIPRELPAVEEARMRKHTKTLDSIKVKTSLSKQFIAFYRLFSNFLILIFKMSSKTSAEKRFALKTSFLSIDADVHA